MKRIISLLVVLVMCAGLFIPSAVLAESVTETTTETVYYFRLPLDRFYPNGKASGNRTADAKFTFEVPAESNGTISVYQIDWDGSALTNETAPALTDKIGDITVTAQSGDYQTLNIDITSQAKAAYERFWNIYSTAADNADKLNAYHNMQYISIALSTKDGIKVRGTEKEQIADGTEYQKLINFDDADSSEVNTENYFYSTIKTWSNAIKSAATDDEKSDRYTGKVLLAGNDAMISNKDNNSNYLIIKAMESSNSWAMLYNLFPKYDAESGDKIYQISMKSKIFNTNVNVSTKGTNSSLMVGFGGYDGTWKFYHNGNGEQGEFRYTLYEANPNNILTDETSAYTTISTGGSIIDGMDLTDWHEYRFSNVVTQSNDYGALIMKLPMVRKGSNGISFDDIKVQEITHQPKIKIKNPSSYSTAKYYEYVNRDQYYAPVAAQVLDFTTVNTGNNVYLYKLPLDYVNAVDADENERKLSVKFDFKTTAGSNGIVAAYKTDWDGGTAPSNLESQITKANRLGAVAVNPNSDNKYGSYSIDITEYARAAVEEYNNSFSASNAKERPYVSVIITTTDNVKLITSAKADETAWAKTLDFNNQTAAASNLTNLKSNLSSTWDRQAETLTSGTSPVNIDYDVYASQKNNSKKGVYIMGDGTENCLVAGTFQGNANKLYFYNMFGDKSTGAKEITSDDIGRIFDISFGAKVSDKAEINNAVPINFGMAGSELEFTYRTTSNGSQCQPYYNIVSNSATGESDNMQKYNGVDLANGDTIKTSWEIQNVAEYGFLRIDSNRVNVGTYSIVAESIQLDNIAVKEITDAPKVEFRNPSKYFDGFEARRQYHAVAAEAKVLIGEINDNMDDMLVCTAVADNSGSTQEAVVRAMIAFYSGDELVTVKLSAPVTVGAGESKNVSIIVSKDSVSGYTEAKGFVWDMNTLKPYTDKQNLQ